MPIDYSTIFTFRNRIGHEAHAQISSGRTMKILETTCRGDTDNLHVTSASRLLHTKVGNMKIVLLAYTITITM